MNTEIVARENYDYLKESKNSYEGSQCYTRSAL